MIDFKVYTSSNGPLSADQLAKMATDEIVAISDTAPAPIRDQAHIFKEHVEQVVCRYINRALDSNLSYLVKETKS